MECNLIHCIVTGVADVINYFISVNIRKCIVEFMKELMDCATKYND